MSTIGKFLLIFGLLAMAILFALSLVLYQKDKRMELAVMGFALAMALTVSGVTATVRNLVETRRTAAAEAEAAYLLQREQITAAFANETWFSQPDGTYIHADGTSADSSQPDASSEIASAAPELPQSAPFTPDEAAQDAPETPIPA